MSKQDTGAIKGIAILAMIFYHLFYNLDVEELGLHTGLIFSGGMTLTITQACHICVPLFVFVTGYGLASIEKQCQMEIRESYKAAFKRYLKLVWDQAYIIIILLFVIYMVGFNHTAADVWGDGLLAQIIGVITNVFGVAGIFKMNWFCGSWWYLGLAVLWIFLVPVLYRIVKKIGSIASGALCILLPVALGLSSTNDGMGRYLSVLVFGIIWAVSDIDQKIMDYCKSKKAFWTAISIVLVLCIPLLIKMKSFMQVNYLIELALTLILVVLSQLLLYKLGPVKKVLAFFGANSKYMWLLHVFIFTYWFREALFGLRNIWLIYIIVVGITLGASLLLRAAKRLVLLVEGGGVNHEILVKRKICFNLGACLDCV